MKKRIKKQIIPVIVIGIIGLLLSGYFSFEQYEIITTGETISGTVTDIITIRGDEGNTYKPEITYTYQGQEQTYLPSYSSNHNSARIGDTLKVIVSEKGTTIAGFHMGLLGLGIGLLVSFIMVFFGIRSMVRHSRRFDLTSQLKLYGQRKQARFIRKDTTGYKLNGQYGTILFVQEENGDRIFQTKPIFSEFSIRWLEEHIFDVYVNTSNPDEYYIDLEKHFGEVSTHN